MKEFLPRIRLISYSLSVNSSRDRRRQNPPEEGTGEHTSGFGSSVPCLVRSTKPTFRSPGPTTRGSFVVLCLPQVPVGKLMLDVSCRKGS